MHPIIYYEKRQHGTREFPAEYYYVDHHHPRYVMSFHWHTEWELIRIDQGHFHIHADGKEISAKAGDVILLRDSMLHGGTPEDCVYECFVFNLRGLFRGMEVIKQHLRPVYHMEILPQIYYPAEADPALAAIIGTLFSACAARDSRSAPEYELSLLGSLCNLFGHILQNKLYDIAQKTSLHTSSRMEQVKAVLTYIEQNYQTNITLNTLAEIAGLNPNYLCRAFQEITHQTPMDYVIFYRIEQAAIMLTSTQLAIMEIALECGFNDHSYFTKTFKRLKGVTPRIYRKNHTRSI